MVYNFISNYNKSKLHLWLLIDYIIPGELYLWLLIDYIIPGEHEDIIWLKYIYMIYIVYLLARNSQNKNSGSNKPTSSHRS
jgi:hypothetical protein